MKNRALFAIVLALISIGITTGCEQKTEADGVIDKLNAMKPEERFAWLQKMGGMSVYQKQAQVDSIRGATAEQKAAWKKQLADEMGGAPGAPATPPPPSNPQAGQRAPMGGGN